MVEKCHCDAHLHFDLFTIYTNKTKILQQIFVGLFDLPMIVFLQQFTVRGNLSLQMSLDIEKCFVLHILMFQIRSQIGQVFFKGANDRLDMVELSTVTAFRFRNGSLQSCSLKRQSDMIRNC